MRKSIFLLCAFFTSLSSYGQFTNVGLSVGTGFATGELRQNLGRTVIPEFGMIITYKFYAPVEVGISIGTGTYHTELEKRRDLYPGFNDELRLRRNNNLANFMGMFRYFPEVKGGLQPFIEAQLGASYLYTRYRIRERALTETIEEGRDMGKWTMAYRIGGGLKIPITKDEAHLELKVLYHDTNPVDYLRRGDTIYDPSISTENFQYSPRRTAFTFIQPSIGVFFSVF